jgi:hypothetical protein
MAFEFLKGIIDLDKYIVFFQGINLQYLKIAYLTLILLLVFWVIWKMYMTLSRRNLFNIKNPHEASGEVAFTAYFLYWLKYLTIFPTLTFVWFILFVFFLKLITQAFTLEEIMTFGIVFISAIRSASYIHRKMAEDLAKLLPLTVLILTIQNPNFITIRLTFADITSFVALLPSFWQYLLFIIGLEFFLKLLHFIFTSIKELRKTES